MIVQYQQQITKKENATFGYKFLNGDLELLKEKEIEIPTLRNKIKHMDGVLDEENTMNLISFIYKNNKQSNKNVRGHINYDVQLIKIKIETGEISTQKVNIDSVYHINSLKFFQPNESSIICAGYASIIGLNNKFNKSSAAFKFDLLDTISKITYNLFPLALVNQNKSKSKASRNFSKQRRDGKYFNPSIPQLVPKMIHLTSDGGLLFVGEQKIPVGNGSSIGIGGGVGLAFAIAATRSKNSHNYIDYKDIICIKYNKNDSIEWSRKISKSQGNPYLETFYGLKTYGSSFNFIEGLEHIYFLYLDNKKT